MIGTLVIRADSNETIGTGHVMRCQSLANAWRKRGGEISFVSNRYQQGTMEDAVDTINIAKMVNANWVVIDGYNFNSDYQKAIKDVGISLLVIDDFGSPNHYYADIILNQNIYAEKISYKNCEKYTRLLLGMKYALLRDEFLEKSIAERYTKDIGTNILVTFGGSDPNNITLKIIEILKKIDNISVIVIIGNTNQNYKSIEQSTFENPKFIIRKDVKTISKYMKWADIAISASGTTYLELIRTRCPSILIPIADNQKPASEETIIMGIADFLLVDELKNHELCTKIISDFLLSYETRLKLSKKMENLIDGNGASRVVSAIIGDILKLRNATMSDCSLVWKWANDPTTRANSFKQEFIPISEHKTWFYEAISNENIKYYIAILGETPIGQARFHTDPNTKSTVISMLISEEFRGLSLGSRIITTATEKFFSESLITTVNAYVKPNNTPSLKSFSRAGYKCEGVTTEHMGVLTHHFVKTRNIL